MTSKAKHVVHLRSPRAKRHLRPGGGAKVLRPAAVLALCGTWQSPAHMRRADRAHPNTRAARGARAVVCAECLRRVS